MDSLRDFDERYNYQQPPFAYEGGLQHYIRDLDTVKDDLIENLGYGDCSMVADTAFELLESHGCKDIKKILFISKGYAESCYRPSYNWSY
jgi:DNA gyrase/topoisomerase IV subunit B